MHLTNFSEIGLASSKGLFFERSSETSDYQDGTDGVNVMTDERITEMMDKVMTDERITETIENLITD